MYMVLSRNLGSVKDWLSDRGLNMAWYLSRTIFEHIQGFDRPQRMSGNAPTRCVGSLSCGDPGE